MDRSLPRGHDSWTVTRCYSSEVLSQPRSQIISNVRPLIDLRSKVTSSGRTLDGLWLQTKTRLRSFTLGVWEPLYFSLEELDSVSRSELSTRNSYWCSAVPVEVAVHSHSCGSKVKFRSMCVEVRQRRFQAYLKPSEIPVSLGIICNTMKELLQCKKKQMSSCLGNISSYSC